MIQMSLHLTTQKYTLVMKIDSFDWDSGNWPKCAKHGLTQREIEEVILNQPAVMSDPCPSEPRMRAIGKTCAGRYVFMVHVIRELMGRCLLRPISARYMHQKEVKSYESQT
jgi:uncharacterized protein